MIGAARIGISGWRYAPWRGRFYPVGLPQHSELAFASRMLPTIELNGSFYSLQRPASYRQWHDETPTGFTFAVKGPRYITHMLRLNRIETPMANFFASGVLALRAKLGPILWQFPPQMAYDEARFDAFLKLLPRDTAGAAELARGHDARLDGRTVLEIGRNRRLRHAVEIRHPSFADAGFVALLRKHKVGLVVADTAGRWPWIEDLTASFVYLRLHGDQELYASGYGDEALDRWALRIAAWRAGTEVADARTVAPPIARRARRDVYCYFDNDVKVHAPYDAAHLAQRVGAPHALGEDGVFATPDILLRGSPARRLGAATAAAASAAS